MGKGEKIDRAIEHLARLGFTAMESEVYVALLRHSPATGYRVATAIGKATANTYKALRTLAEKGAILHEEGDGSLYRAVPVKELLARRTREFEEQRDAAFEALKNVGDDTIDTGVYRLHSHDQVIQRAREMIDRAQEVTLMVGFPSVVAALQDALEAAAERGVAVAVKSYAVLDMVGVEFIESTESTYWQRESPGMELQLVVDAEEYLIALMTDVDVLQAIWSASPFLGYMTHNSIALEHTITGIAGAVKAGADIAAVRRMMRVKHHPVATPGHRKLMQAAERASKKTRGRRKTPREKD